MDNMDIMDRDRVRGVRTKSELKTDKHECRHAPIAQK